MPVAYDPLNYENLARSVVNALTGSDICGLPPVENFEGAGVYAIYYAGPFPAYHHISSAACEIPIYVGKAIPAGGRKGAQESAGEGVSLLRRLNDHAKSISATHNLELSDFRCRYLVVLPVWVGLAEQFLINHFRPIWNIYVAGFGNHNVGRGRHGGKRPQWDIVHPGRSWAENLDTAETAEEILGRLPAY
jgi:hypothetical protein